MTDADMQAIVKEVMRRMLAGDGPADNAPANGRTTSNGNISSQTADNTTVNVTTVVTRNDIEAFVKEGKKRLLVKHGGLVTPLARDLAAEHGLEIIWAGESNGSQTQHTITGTSSNGKSALTCLRCSSCLEPAFYERALAELEHSTARVLGELRAYIARCWLHEPADIATLRAISRPPMGNLPCCFYANFNLFWAGESLQVCRQQVKEGTLPVQVVSAMLSGLLERHAARLEKWSMTETVALERMLAHYFKSKSPASSEEFLAVVEHAMIALDRVQSWIDGLIPWSELDARLALRRPISVI
ncbi:MAG TPA: hypothetical protein VFQ36_01615 [Ktedonobacteraceae bacterium]|nr:hypothetical protein [Ktedonobacteraceae bacterium]